MRSARTKGPFLCRVRITEPARIIGLKRPPERSCPTGFEKTRRNYHREESKQPGTVILLRSTGHLHIHTHTCIRSREFVVAAGSCIVKLHFSRRATQLHYVFLRDGKSRNMYTFITKLSTIFIVAIMPNRISVGNLDILIKKIQLH